MAENTPKTGKQIVMEAVQKLKPIRDFLDGYVKATKHEGVKNKTEEFSKILKEMEDQCAKQEPEDDYDEMDQDNGDKA